MVVLRFRSDKVRQTCTDLARMRRSWGPVVARQISRRLQQLEAMTNLADLKFLPFDSHEHDGGLIEVTITDRLSIFIERGPDMSEGDTPMYTIIVIELRAPRPRHGCHDL